MDTRNRGNRVRHHGLGQQGWIPRIGATKMDTRDRGIRGGYQGQKMGQTPETGTPEAGKIQTNHKKGQRWIFGTGDRLTPETIVTKMESRAGALNMDTKDRSNRDVHQRLF